MTFIARQFIASCALFTWSTAAFSHDGHGLSGIHWHATDVWGFLAVAAMVAVAVWLSKK